MGKKTVSIIVAASTLSGIIYLMSRTKALVIRVLDNGQVVDTLRAGETYDVELTVRNKSDEPQQWDIFLSASSNLRTFIQPERTGYSFQAKETKRIQVPLPIPADAAGEAGGASIYAYVITPDDTKKIGERVLVLPVV